MKNKTLYWVIFATLAIRLGYGFFVRHFSIAGDGIEYQTIAMNLLHGHGFSLDAVSPSAVRAPLFPFFVYLMYALFGTSPTVIMVAQAVLCALTAWAIYHVAVRTFGPRPAIVASLVYAVYPILIDYSNTLLSETLFTFILCLSIASLLEGMRSKKAMYFIFAGIALGGATLTRGTTILLPFVLLAVFVRGRINFRYWVVFTASVFIVISVWEARNYHLFHKIIPVCTTGAGLGIYLSGYEASGQGYYEDAIANGRALKEHFQADDGLGYEQCLTARGSAMIRHNKLSYLMLAIKRLPRFWLTSHSGIYDIGKTISEYKREGDYRSIVIRYCLLLMQGVFLAAAALGIYFSFRSGGTAASLLLLLIIVYFTGHIALDPCPRYQLPAMPYIFIFGAYGIMKLFHMRDAGE